MKLSRNSENKEITLTFCSKLKGVKYIKEKFKKYLLFCSAHGRKCEIAKVIVTPLSNAFCPLLCRLSQVTYLLLPFPSRKHKY